MSVQDGPGAQGMALSLHRAMTTQGNAMMQGQLFYNQKDTTGTYYCRDYLQGRLSQALTAGHSCQVSCYVVNERPTYAINSNGAYLGNAAIDATHNPAVLDVTDIALFYSHERWIRIGGMTSLVRPFGLPFCREGGRKNKKKFPKKFALFPK